MFSLLPLHALLVLLTASLCSANAPISRPLKRLAHPSTQLIEIIPRTPIPLASSAYRRRLPSPHINTLRHDDSFRLILSAFDETFHLHLRPNEHLVHPSAQINYYDIGPDGRSVITHTKPLHKEDVKVYWGEVISPEHSPTRLREDAARVMPTPNHPSELGWARIMVHHQGDSDAGIPPEFEGAFSVNGNIYHIMTKYNYERTRHPLDQNEVEIVEEIDSNLVIWRESDMMSPEEEHFAKTGERIADGGRGKMLAATHGCAHDRLQYNNDPEQNPILRPSPPPAQSWWDDPLGRFFANSSSSSSSLTRRTDLPSNGMVNNFREFIGQTAGCPTTQKILLMGVAADCTYTEQLGSQENATRQILNSFNTASTLYKNTFNVSLGILKLNIQNRGCPNQPDPSLPWNVNCSPDVTLTNRLSSFSRWRGTQQNDSIGLWHLMSGCPTGTEVGVAWLGTLCQDSASPDNSGDTISGTGVSTSGRLEWQVVSHEVGHNFGAIHDCSTDGCTTSPPCCPLSAATCDAGGQFLMNPVAQASESRFSPCSLGAICSSMRGVEGARTDTSCLIDPRPDLQLVGLQMCGNGIVESGEDCDPGQGVESACCDTSTCKFRSGALCDPLSSACCTDQCAFAPASQVCRASKDQACDMPEMCTGNSSACPEDRMAPNGQSCGSGDLRCASGLCTSVSLQCQMIGGSIGLREACPNQDDSCQVSCRDPNVPNACRVLTALLVDGSPCGFGGTCISGRCQSGNALDTAKAWYTQNLQIAIPVTIVAGLVALLLLWALYRGIKRCCSGNRRTQPRTFVANIPPMAAPLPSPHHQRLASYDPSVPAYARAPPSADLQSRSNVVYSPVPMHNRYPSGSLAPSQARTKWVDDTIYNGPR